MEKPSCLSFTLLKTRKTVQWMKHKQGTLVQIFSTHVKGWVWLYMCAGDEEGPGWLAASL